MESLNAILRSLNQPVLNIFEQGHGITQVLHPVLPGMRKIKSSGLLGQESPAQSFFRKGDQKVIVMMSDQVTKNKKVKISKS